MNRDVLTIIKKEFARFFGDKRLLFTTVFMPGLLIYIMYTFMGKGIVSSMSTSEDYKATVYTVELPESIKAVFENADITIVPVTASEVESSKELIMTDEIDALMVFPDSFEVSMHDYDISSGEKAPEISIFYNSADTESLSTYRTLVGVLDAYESSVANKFDVNVSENKYDQATEKETTGMIFSMIMPLLLMIFMYTGCMAVAPDSIAGEKERGTIATLLVTPIKRSSLALGKIISLSVFSLLSGLSSFIGTMLSMPALMGGEVAADSGLSASVYGVKEYVLLLAIILSTVLFFVSVLAVISGFAKNVKEASTLILPFMLLIMGVAIGSMMGTKKEMSLVDSFIPIYGIAKSISGIFAFNYSVMLVLISVVVNFIIAIFMTFILTRMFNDEKVMFSN